ncbi:hypothetical protein C8T65DRAFT_662162, partial [Cerioporus squamosus]
MSQTVSFVTQLNNYLQSPEGGRDLSRLSWRDTPPGTQQGWVSVCVISGVEKASGDGHSKVAARNAATEKLLRQWGVI